MENGRKTQNRTRGLAANAYVSGEMYEEDDDDEGAIYFSFEAYNRQGDVELTKLALLYISWDIVEGLNDHTLYGENGEEIRPDKKSRRGLRYSLEHFSRYYHRKR